MGKTSECQLTGSGNHTTISMFFPFAHPNNLLVALLASMDCEDSEGESKLIEELFAPLGRDALRRGVNLFVKALRGFAEKNHPGELKAFRSADITDHVLDGIYAHAWGPVLDCFRNEVSLHKDELPDGFFEARKEAIETFAGKTVIRESGNGEKEFLFPDASQLSAGKWLGEGGVMSQIMCTVLVELHREISVCLPGILSRFLLMKEKNMSKAQARKTADEAIDYLAGIMMPGKANMRIYCAIDSMSFTSGKTHAAPTAGAVSFVRVADICRSSRREIVPNLVALCAMLFSYRLRLKKRESSAGVATMDVLSSRLDAKAFVSELTSKDYTGRELIDFIDTLMRDIFGYGFPKTVRDSICDDLDECGALHRPVTEFTSVYRMGYKVTPQRYAELRASKHGDYYTGLENYVKAMVDKVKRSVKAAFSAEEKNDSSR